MIIKIHGMLASKEELELNLSAWTRVGGVKRVLTLSDESYGSTKFDYNYSLKINEISDFETAEGEVNSRCSKLECLLLDTGLPYPLGGRLIGQARVTKIKFENKKNDMHYFSSDIYFQQSLYESIERSLQTFSKFRIEVEGVKYDENNELTGFHGGEKSCLDESFVITRVSFKGVDEKIITAS
jgi:hypothetical protein